MNDLNMLDQLRPIADEMLGGLHAGEVMRLGIRRAAAKQPDRRVKWLRLAPALCCAALVCVAAVRLAQPSAQARDPLAIESIAAGDGAQPAVGALVADLGDGARIRSASAREESLFVGSEQDIPMIALNGGVYRMLRQAVAPSQLGGSLGSVRTHTAEPSLASGEAMAAGLSNVAAEGTAIYAVGGLPGSTAVAAEVDGSLRLFQRVSYAGVGPGGLGLEDTFAVRGQVAELTLSGVGTLSGDAANAAMDVLLDRATLKSADATARRQTLTVTLDSGLMLQLGVSGDTLCGCGGWSCPEFFEAFEAAL